jgi:hypothetical protein
MTGLRSTAAADRTITANADSQRCLSPVSSPIFVAAHRLLTSERKLVAYLQLERELRTGPGPMAERHALMYRPDRCRRCIRRCIRLRNRVLKADQPASTTLFALFILDELAPPTIDHPRLPVEFSGVGVAHACRPRRSIRDEGWPLRAILPAQSAGLCPRSGRA